MYEQTQSHMLNVNIDFLKVAYREVMENGVAVEIGAQYGKNLNRNLENLLWRIQNGSYFPQLQDWLQMEDVEGHCKKYVFRAFEDQILRYLFGKILKAIYEPKIQHSIANLKKESLSQRSRWPNLAKVEIDVAEFLTKLNLEDMIHFLEQDIVDKNFVRYIGRLLQSGVKLHTECVDSESKSSLSFFSMMQSVCEYYILQILDSNREKKLNGKISVAQRDKNLKILFENVDDAQMVYRRLYRGLREMEIDLTKDKICTLTKFFESKKQFDVARLQRGKILRASYQRINSIWEKGKKQG